MTPQQKRDTKIMTGMEIFQNEVFIQLLYELLADDNFKEQPVAVVQDMIWSCQLKLKESKKTLDNIE